MSLLVLDVIEGPMSLFPGEETVDWEALEEDRLWFLEVWEGKERKND